MSVASLSLIPGLRPFFYQSSYDKIKKSHFTKQLKFLNET